MKTRIKRCPICGSELQATRTIETSGAVLDSDGDAISLGRSVEEEFTIYCAEDHSLNEIREALERE